MAAPPAPTSTGRPLPAETRQEPPGLPEEGDPRDAKKALRAELRERRARIEPGVHAEASRRAGLEAMTVLPLAPGALVSAFWPLGDEIDTRPLLKALHQFEVTVALPRLEGRGRPLAFHRWLPDEALEPGPWGLMQPPEAAPLVVPKIMLVPLLGFDRRGYRIGYGGGFYDRTIDALRGRGPAPMTAGFAFALQEVEDLPIELTDQRLDLVITEAGTIRP